MRGIGWMLIAAAVLLTGCAGREAGGSATATVASGAYAEAFDAARELLLERGFVLDRVDARAGVISTERERTAGLATPWDREQVTLDDEYRDLYHRHQRIARVTFRPVEELGTPGQARGQASTPTGEAGWDADWGAADLRRHDGELVAQAWVVIERVHRPGLQLEPESVSLSGLTRDTQLVERGMWPEYAVAHERDRALESWLIRRLSARLAIEPGRAGAAQDRAD